MNKLRMFLPDKMSHEQEVKLSELSNRLKSYGFGDKWVRKWWQTPMYELNGFCPLEALCVDKFDLVHKSLDKTVRLYEDAVYSIEQNNKEMKKILEGS